MVDKNAQVQNSSSTSKMQVDEFDSSTPRDSIDSSILVGVRRALSKTKTGLTVTKSPSPVADTKKVKLEFFGNSDSTKTLHKIQGVTGKAVKKTSRDEIQKSVSDQMESGDWIQLDNGTQKTKTRKPRNNLEGKVPRTVLPRAAKSKALNMMRGIKVNTKGFVLKKPIAKKRRVQLPIRIASRSESPKSDHNSNTDVTVSESSESSGTMRSCSYCGCKCYAH